MPHLALSLLGPFHATLDDKPITNFESNKVRGLLAFLALESNCLHSREALAGLMWPDFANRDALSNLRYALSNLRQALGDQHATLPWLLITRDTLQFNRASDYWVDAEWCLDSTVDTLPIPELESHLVTYRGVFLEGFACHSAPFEEWVLLKRERIGQQVMRAFRRLIADYEQRGEHLQVEIFARKQLGIEPWDEHAHQQLMRALARSGQRTAALAQYEICRRALKHELEVEPSRETTELYHAIGDGKLGAYRRRHDDYQQPLLPGNLPIPATSFIGRQSEMADVKRRFETTRLLTLTGAGGCGKTRLAIQAATDLAYLPCYQEGVWWVDFAPLNDATRVPQMVAAQFGLLESFDPPITALVKHLRAKKLLLIFDNCEHLIAACAELIAALLEVCPHLKILATSREPLHVAGEVVQPVPPLSVPDGAHLPPTDELLGYDAIHLFSERARAIAPYWSLDANSMAVVNICTRLDGIPLALELAAARVQILSVSQIAARLADRFSLLTRGRDKTLPRHQTLRATMEWSFELLAEQEQILLRRLAIFVGGFTLDAVEAVCAGGPDFSTPSLLDQLASLIEKSLVVVEPNHRTMRYRLLETTREYAREKLAPLEFETMRDRHLDYFLHLAETSEPSIRAGRPVVLEQIETDYSNLHSALDYAITHKLESAVRLGAALDWFWDYTYRKKEGDELAQRILALTDPGKPSRVRAMALGIAGSRADIVGNYSSANDLLHASLEMARGLDDKHQMMNVLNDLAAMKYHAGQWAQMQPFAEQALVLGRELNNHHAMGNALWQLGTAASGNGDDTLARTYFGQSLELARQEDMTNLQAFSLMSLARLARLDQDYVTAEKLYLECARIRQTMHFRNALAQTLVNLGQVTLHAGDCARALGFFCESETIFRDLGDDNNVTCLAGFAGVMGRTGQLKLAAQLFGALPVNRESGEFKMAKIAHLVYDPIIAHVREQLGETEWNAKLTQGRAMMVGQAIEYALKNLNEIGGKIDYQFSESQS